MKKTDIIVVGVLMALLFAWGPLCSWLFPPQQQQQNRTLQGSLTNAPKAAVTGETAVVAQNQTATNALPPASTQEPVRIVEQADAQLPWSAVNESPAHAAAGPQRVALSNSLLKIVVSSWGGGIESATLKGYPQTNSPSSLPVLLDLAAMPSLCYVGLPGLSSNNDFTLEASDGRITISRIMSEGLTFRRTLTLTDSYRIHVSDRFVNTGDKARGLPIHGIHVGPMYSVEEKPDPKQPSQLGIDTQASHGGEKVKHWAADRTLMGKFGGAGGCMLMSKRLSRPMPYEVHMEQSSPTDWVAVKSRFFAQFLAPQGEAATAFTLHVWRNVSSEEAAAPASPDVWATSPAVRTVACTLYFSARDLKAGESFTREMIYYVGPKKHSILGSLGKADIMEFGFWAKVCNVLLPTLNFIAEGFSFLSAQRAPNYGMAIIVLTLLIRIVFWPVMKKSTDSMKKMQALNPELQEIRTKYKDDQQKLLRKQQELFKKHGVSPLSGCLPILIQIPVFIALFTVLRSSVELRFSSFLWIRDLSEPERLLDFGFAIPLIGWDTLNLLPFAMTATMIWQQKMTPTTGDPQQQKMMAIMMPVLMLVFFYNMPSALVLYWTTSQCLSIGQLLLQNRLDKRRSARTAAMPAQG